MAAEISITAQKKTFLTTQIRHLGAPLTLPSTSSSIPDPTLEKIVESTNKKITAHNRLVFGIQSQSHVVQQLDSLYWNDALADGLPSRKAETCVKRETDLTDSKHGLRTIPVLWEDVTLGDSGRASKRRRIAERDQADSNEEDNSVNAEENDDEHIDDADDYEHLHVKLSTQIDRRDQLRGRLAQLKKLQALLEPFEDPIVNIQPNLITRDNKELDNELARMRILMAKVGSGLQRRTLQTDSRGSTQPNQNIQSDKERLNDLLSL